MIGAFFSSNPCQRVCEQGMTPGQFEANAVFQIVLLFLMDHGFHEGHDFFGKPIIGTIETFIQNINPEILDGINGFFFL
jgi:hypothetical protein